MKKTLVTYIDDVSGKPASKVETITFAVEGQLFEIDLNPLNAANFRRSVAKYVKNARKVSGSPRKALDGRKVTHPKDYVHAVRTWAQEQGYEVANRGRVPLSLYKAYEDAKKGA